MIAKILEKIKIKELNKMQQESLDINKDFSDCVILSPTGSGKTLAFLLPLLYHLDENIKEIQAVIITPTRELAIQIETVFKSFGTNFKINATYGGHEMKVEKNNFKDTPHLIVGTPGRICDHILRENIDLSNAKTLILDEFDKCLELGFQEQMEFIINHINNVRKRLLVSATNMEIIPEFTGIKGFNVINYLEIENQQPDIEIRKVVSIAKDKLFTLVDLLKNIQSGPTIVFSNHREPVERISNFLSDEGIVNVFFHGGMEQAERERALIKFRNGSSQILVSTDLGSRGLDIPEIKNIIHYHLPIKEDSFIHRNGRTARMSANGKSFVLTTTEEPLPDFIENLNLDELILKENKSLPAIPEWETLYVSAGKKDKINKIDIVGFLSQKGSLKKEDIGLIHSLDFMTFVAVKRKKINILLKNIRDQKIKGKSVRFGVSR